MGASNVVVPEFHTKRTLTAFVLAFALLLLIMFGAVLAAFINKSTAAGFLSLIATVSHKKHLLLFSRPLRSRQ